MCPATHRRRFQRRALTVTNDYRAQPQPHGDSQVGQTVAAVGTQSSIVGHSIRVGAIARLIQRQINLRAIQPHSTAPARTERITITFLTLSSSQLSSDRRTQTRRSAISELLSPVDRHKCHQWRLCWEFLRARNSLHKSCRRAKLKGHVTRAPRMSTIWGAATNGYSPAPRLHAPENSPAQAEYPATPIDHH